MRCASKPLPISSHLTSAMLRSNNSREVRSGSQGACGEDRCQFTAHTPIYRAARAHTDHCPHHVVISYIQGKSVFLRVLRFHMLLHVGCICTLRSINRSLSNTAPQGQTCVRTLSDFLMRLPQREHS